MLTLIFILLTTLNAYSKTEQPSWVSNPPLQDSIYKYYLGYSDGEKNESKAIESADNHAADEAIRENFGVMITFNNEGIFTDTSEVMRKRVQQFSNTVRLNGFEKMKIWTFRTTNSEFGARVLFRYSKSAIIAELKRQQEPQPEEKYLLNIQGRSNPLRGNMEISSIPQGAKIFIDNEPYAVTPILIQGQLESGHHQIRLEHPQFEDKGLEVEVIPGVTAKIKEVLIPARSAMEVTSIPEGAMVFIDNKFQGTTPTLITDLPVKKTFAIKFEHPDTLPLTVEGISLEKNERKEIKVSLNYRTEMILIRSEPSDAPVYIDGRYRGNTPYKADLEIKEHDIKINLIGYHEYSTSINLKGFYPEKILAVLEKEQDHQIEDKLFSDNRIQGYELANHQLDIPFHIAISYNLFHGRMTDPNILGSRSGNLLVFDLYFDRWGITKSVGTLSNSSDPSWTGSYLGSDGAVDKTQLWFWVPSSEIIINKIALGIGVEIEKYSYSYYAKNKLGTYEKFQTNTSGMGFCFGGNYFFNSSMFMSTRMGFLSYTGGSRVDELPQSSQSSAYFILGLGLNLL